MLLMNVTVMHHIMKVLAYLCIPKALILEGLLHKFLYPHQFPNELMDKGWRHHKSEGNLLVISHSNI